MMRFLDKTLRHVFRQGPAANLEAAKATAHRGEPHWTTDTKRLYVSDADGGEAGHQMHELAMMSDFENGKDTTVTVVTDIRHDGTQLQKKTQELTFEMGILTQVGPESDWANTTDI